MSKPLSSDKSKEIKNALKNIKKKYFIDFDKPRDFPLLISDRKNNLQSLVIEYYCIFIYPVIENEQADMAKFKRGFIFSLISLISILLLSRLNSYHEIFGSITIVLLITFIVFFSVSILISLKIYNRFNKKKIKTIKARLKKMNYPIEEAHKNLEELESLWLQHRIKGKDTLKLIEKLEIYKSNKKKYNKDAIQYLLNFIKGSNFMKFLILIIGILIQLTFAPLRHIINSNMDKTTLSEIYSLVGQVGVTTLIVIFAILELIVFFWAVSNAFNFVLILIDKPQTYNPSKVDMLIKLLNNHIKIDTDND